MNLKSCCVAVLASAAVLTQANAGGHHSSGTTTAASSGRGSVPSRGAYYRGMRYSGVASPRIGYPSHAMGGLGPNHVYSSRPTLNGTNQFSARTLNSSERFGNASQFGQNRTFAHSNNLRPNWQNHVVARQSAGSHLDWDRGRDHWWHGHRCSFIGGSWVIFDFGFDPWWPSPYWYPYYYPPYPYGYYPSGYDQGYPDEGAYDQESPTDRYYRENGK